MRVWCGSVVAAALLTLGFAVPLAQQVYRPAEDWATLPDGMTWAEVSGVAVDSGERMFALQRNDPPMLEFDPSGRMVRTWGSGQLVWPHGLRVDRYGFLWITDGRGRNGQGHQVFKYTRDGQRVMTLGTAGIAGDGPNTFNGPTDVAIAANGDIFVADGHVNSRIVKFSKEGRFIKAWGRKGSGPGEFDVPHSLAFDGQGRLLVADRSNKRIQVFDQEGTFITNWSGFGSPSGIFVSPDDTLYVVDANDAKRLFVGSAKDGSITHVLKDLTLAESVAVDRLGNVYVGETTPGKMDNGMETGHRVRKLLKN